MLCPQGTGLDCHRTWEVLIVGCIPIVLSSNLDELYKDLPIVVIESWDKLNKQFLEKEHIRIQKNKNNKNTTIYNYEKLTRNEKP